MNYAPHEIRKRLRKFIPPIRFGGEESTLKLPKQWKDWCAAARLRPRKTPYHTSKRGLKSEWMYLHGHGREWRVNCFGDLECGDTYADFDRWALCTIESTYLPKTKSEFVLAVKVLLAKHSEVIAPEKWSAERSEKLKQLLWCGI